MLLLFRGHDAGGPAPPAPTPDDRDVVGVSSKNASVAGNPTPARTATGAASKNASVTGRPPNP